MHESWGNRAGQCDRVDAGDLDGDDEDGMSGRGMLWGVLLSVLLWAALWGVSWLGRCILAGVC